MREILFVSVHPPGRVPSQRFRYEQYVDFLAEHGYRTTFSPVLRPGEHVQAYSPGHAARKGVIAARGVLRRLGDLLRARRYDIVFVQREAVPFGTAIFEAAFSRSPARLVFDFDDSIWLPNASEANRRFAWLKRPGKTADIIARADLVFAGNEYLRSYAARFNTRVVVIPTTIDTDRYVRSNGATRSQTGEPVCIGWSGSMTTVQHFKLVLPVFRRLRRRYGSRVTFAVIGDPAFRDDELGIVGQPWSADTEVEDLGRFDVGVMPLPDDDWARGKCGLKGLQYMGLEIPAVMSPVGVNTEIVEDGRNGFLAGSEDEWFDKLSRLIESADLRKRLGTAARETVVERYSVESQKQRYVAHFDRLLEADAT